MNLEWQQGAACVPVFSLSSVECASRLRTHDEPEIPKFKSSRWQVWVACSLLALAGLSSSLTARAGEPLPSTPHPLLFTTQVPVPFDFATIGSTFANHLTAPRRVFRGGDLWLRGVDGSLRNLTEEAGFGMPGMQLGNAIAVRDPAVHWSGQKALFSMLIGAPDEFEQLEVYWQIYEVSGFGAGQTLSITRIATQPADVNNVMPVYGSDDSILFASDRSRDGARHLYPQLDEYESTPTLTGLWKLDPGSGRLTLLDHSPSGDFDPFVDSFGRILFTRWDHLQRDQQGDEVENPSGAFNFASEAVDAVALNSRDEVFPEPRIAPQGSITNDHRFNNFFPWQIAQDGSRAEFLNHLGRHELLVFFDRSFNNDANLRAFISAISGRTNPNPIENLFHMSEHPNVPGRYVGIDALEFATHSAGQIVALNAPPSANPDDIEIEYLTPRSTQGTTPAPDHSGHYRDPLWLSDGSLLVAHADQQGPLANVGTPTAPQPSHRFRLRLMQPGPGGIMLPGALLTTGIQKNLSFWDPDQLLTYSGDLWEWQAVEVRARAQPPLLLEPGLDEPEAQVFAEQGVDEAELRAFLRRRELGLMIVRDLTARDQADRQQPYNLRVPGGIQTVGSGGAIYDIDRFQLIQGDQVRAYDSLEDGRRVLARLLHDARVRPLNLPLDATQPDTVGIASDGSIAMFVPARRALSWQSNSPQGEPVVRERFWLTWQAGEIRSCDGCHGINRSGQAGQGQAQQAPAALGPLLANWRAFVTEDLLFDDGFVDLQ